MTFKDFWAREKHVALNVQSRKFRIVKWIIILLFSLVLYWWKGLHVVLAMIFIGALAGLFMHFFLRYKTDAWTKSWGPYKRIRLNGE